MSIQTFVMSHPFLFSALAVVLALVVMMEIQRIRRLGSGVDPATAVQMINREAAWVLDVRDAAAFKQGHIVDAKNIPQARLDEALAGLDGQKNRPVIVCCEVGVTATAVVERLLKAGFHRAVLLRGGLRAWREAGLPLEKR
ncbi:MAG TPA: rhodanese-like domain-containing protein [Candidatus Acidoferrales bacterium]|nr:rhodanese-like domain-containing protein [Candidatus Acidoferrales bacterium]